MGCSNSIILAGQENEEKLQDKYVIGPKIGEGSFGQVRQCKEKCGDQVFAVKILDTRKYNDEGEVICKRDPQSMQAIRAEEQCWKKVGQHRNCVQYLASFAEDSLYFMVMERCSKSLMERLDEMYDSSEKDLVGIFRQMLLGIEHCHSVGIVHRDIKPDNFLFTDRESKIVKLCDFGLAELIPRIGKLCGTFGTSPYMCPEMLNDEGYNEKADIWSLGATSYLILFGEFPYMPKDVNPHDMKEMIRCGHPRPKFQRIEGDDPASDVATNFVRSLLNRMPECRLSATQALKLPFVSEEKESTLTRSLTASRLGPIFHQAKDHAQEFKNAVDPTVQRSLDELLEKLQDPKNRAELFRRSFSLNKNQVEVTVCPLPADERICRRATKLSTHSGVVSTDLSDILTTIDNMDDLASECSTESESSFHWEPRKAAGLRDFRFGMTPGTKKMKDIVNHLEEGAEETRNYTM